MSLLDLCSIHRAIATALPILCVTIALIMHDGAQAADPDESEYRHALQLARDGELQSAIELFNKVVSAHPENARFRYDYAVVLGWAGHDAEVLQLIDVAALSTLPPYVLETVGKSARNVRRYDVAEQAYRLAVERDASRLDAQIGLGYVLSENGKPDEAIAHLSALTSSHPDNIDVLAALAEAQSTAQHHIDALQTYERILSLALDDRPAKRGRIFAASRLGATQRAYELALAEPTLTSDAERHSLALDRAAQLVRWDAMAPSTNRPRHSELDEAIAIMERTLAAIQSNDSSTSALRLRARSDLVVAYQQRYRSRDAITTYEALEQERVPIPPYTTQAAADAYLTERQPQRARDLYNSVLSQSPENFQAHMGVFYASMDATDYEAALTWIDHMVATPHFSQGETRLATHSTAALARAWTDDLAGAQQRLETLIHQAPFNAETHQQLGAVYLNRGWPRAALDEIAIARTINPTALAPQVGEFEARLRYADYGAAEQLLLEVERDNADVPSVKRQRRAWAHHRLRELRIDVMTGSSDGTQIGSESWDADAFLYSAPWDDHYRVYGHTHYSQAQFVEGDADYTRYGIGLDYRSSGLKWNTELTRGAAPYSDTGFYAGVRWHIDDYWTLHLSGDSFSNDVPLRGRFNENVDGRAANIGVDYQWHESRAASLSAQRMAMSDGNQRTALSAALYQRLVARPRYKLDGWLRLYTSENTRENASYFNPSSDFSPAVTLRNEWLGWRRYERAFLHRLSLTAGTYRQAGFRSGTLWAISYEHDWALSERLNLLYGISRSMHPYDAVDEFENRLYGSLVWRF